MPTQSNSVNNDIGTATRLEGKDAYGAKLHDGGEAFTINAKDKEDIRMALKVGRAVEDLSLGLNDITNITIGHNERLQPIAKITFFGSNGDKEINVNLTGAWKNTLQQELIKAKLISGQLIN